MHHVTEQIKIEEMPLTPITLITPMPRYEDVMMAQH